MPLPTEAITYSYPLSGIISIHSSVFSCQILLFLSFFRFCLDLIELISGSVEQTVCSFNMPRDMRLMKWREEWERCKKQQHDYEHGQLEKQHKQLVDKIQETAEALKLQLESDSQCQTIIEEAKAQSEHEGFFALHRRDKDMCGARQFARKCLLKAIADKYKEVKQWATDELMVERACYDIKLPLSEIERNYSPQSSRVELEVNYVREHFDWVFFVFHSLFLAPINLPGMIWCSLTQFRSETAIKLVPSLHITNLAEQTSFVSSVMDTYTATVSQLVSNNQQELKNLLRQFLIRDVRSARILTQDIPEHIKETKNKLNTRASSEEKDKDRFQSILHKSNLIWNQLATTVLKLNVHIWPSESVHVPRLSAPDGNHSDHTPLSLPNGLFHDAVIKTGSQYVKKSTLMVIDLKMNEFLSKTIALAVVLPRYNRFRFVHILLYCVRRYCNRAKLEHKNVVQVYGSVLLDPDAIKIGLLFEPCASKSVTDELFATDRELKIEKACQMVLDVSHAICYLHNTDIVLRGFSLENLKVYMHISIILVD